MSISRQFESSKRYTLLARVGLLIIPAAALFITACAGGGSGSTTGTPVSPQALTAPLQLNVGDDPCDRVASLTLDFSSVDLKKNGGDRVPALAGSSVVEFMHLLGALQSISLVNVPQGNYSGADLTISSADITYLSPVTGDLTSTKLSGPWTTSVAFSPDMVVTDTAVSLNLHLAVGDSITFDADGNVSFNPKFTPDFFKGGSAGQHNRQYGGLDHATGRVTAIAESSFVMTQMANSITIQTDSGTQFDGIDGMKGLATGMIVSVDADMQSDGSLLADAVHLAERGGSGMAATGLIVSMTGSPVSQIAVVTQDGTGSGITETDMGTILTGNVSSSTVFSIDSAGMDLNGLPFVPEFSSTSIFKGQAVQIASGSGMMHDGSGQNSNTRGGSASVSNVHLEKQGIRGTVSSHSGNGNQATFTLNVPPESFFAHVTGATSVMVFQRQDTEVWGSGTLTDGASVVVHGLLFGGSDNYKLVASRIVVH